MYIDTNTIRYHMSLQFMTQLDLAETAGIAQSTISTALSKGRCSTGTAKKIAAALKIDPQELAVKERSTKWH